LSIGTAFYKPQIPKRVWVVGAVCAALPDLDSIGFGFGIHYADLWGHRGFTHSIVFAALLAAGVLVVLFRREIAGITRLRLWLFLFLAMASHGVLDAMTHGGLGVAFFSPFDNSRYFLPWRPIVVAPISIRRFFTMRGWEVMRSKFIYVWVPAIALGALVILLRRRALRESAMTAQSAS
jgi:inner membrane protein